MFRYITLLAVLVGFVAPAAAAQEGPVTPATGRVLTLDEALAAAGAGSEELIVAEAEVETAEAEISSIRAGRLPQLSASASYSRALASQFQALGGGGEGDPAPIRPECEGPYLPDPTLPLAERLARLETELGCPADAGGFGGFDFGEIGFGSENTYNLGLNLSWSVFSAGRLQAQTRIARAGRAVAEIGLTTAQAQLRLGVTEAYFDAQLADRLLAIARSTQDQLDEALRLTELRAAAGSQAEFEVVRASVAARNQMPQVIQRSAQRQLAFDRLAMLINVSPDQPLELTTTLDDIDAAALAAVDAAARATVRQAEQAVEVQRDLVRVARSQRLPEIVITSQYGQVYFGGLVPKLGEFRDNWTVGAALQFPLFDGGRIRAGVRSAEAGLRQADARLQQARELSSLDTRSAEAQLDAARALLIASLGTVEQAERGYQIASLRFEEGISTQLELTDARILLEQARANQAQAARDVRVALTRIELLPFLPATMGGAAAASGFSGAAPSQSRPSTGAGGGGAGSASFGGGAGAGGFGGGF